MALALQIEHEDSTILDPMVSLADITTPQPWFQSNIAVRLTGKEIYSNSHVPFFTFETSLSFYQFQSRFFLIQHGWCLLRIHLAHPIVMNYTKVNGLMLLLNLNHDCQTSQQF